MQDELGRYLNSGMRLFQKTRSWGPIPLLVTYYLGVADPPLAFVSSVRAIVFRDTSVVVLNDPRGKPYVIPGGRVEQGETLLDTLRREILEEAGWTIIAPKPLGWVHLHHLGPKPENYKYPYPDFLWPVYIAEACESHPHAVIPDPNALDPRLVLIDEARTLPMEEGERLLFEEALKRRART